MARDAAFEALFDAEFARCTRVARRIVGDSAVAAELAAEAFARAWSRWPSLRERSPGGWVMRVTVNLAIDVTRRRRPVPDRTEATPSSEDLLATRLALAGASARLPRRQRDAVVLRYLADLSEADVAAALGVSSGSVKTHLHRGVAALRRTLGPNLEETNLAGDT